jgi:hypothetical protein
MCSKQVHNVYRFMYHYICKLRINLISQYFPGNTGISHRPGKYVCNYIGLTKKKIIIMDSVNVEIYKIDIDFDRNIKKVIRYL